MRPYDSWVYNIVNDLPHIDTKNLEHSYQYCMFSNVFSNWHLLWKPMDIESKDMVYHLWVFSNVSLKFHLRTLIASRLFLISVCSQMFLQTAILWESLWTMISRIWFLIYVSNVFSNHPLVRKSLDADYKDMVSHLCGFSNVWYFPQLWSYLLKVSLTDTMF